MIYFHQSKHPRKLISFMTKTTISSDKSSALETSKVALWLTNALFSRRRDSGIILLTVVLLEFGIAAIVYSTGGTKYVYLQFMYLPVMLGGLLFGSIGGIIVAGIAGLLLGPFMPLEVEKNLAQPTLSWLVRTGFFCLIGGSSGVLSSLLRQRMRMIESVAQELSVTYGRTLHALVSLVQERDDKTADHSERVAYNAVVIGRELGINQDNLETLYWSGVLHDLGKIGISEQIINKPGPLTPTERLDMQRHPVIGERVLLNASPDFAPIAKAVRSHHERWDGRGYPDQIKGETIPVEARVVAVLDVFEALTSKRPYREPMSTNEALLFLRENAGTHFDAQIVDIFTSLHHSNKLAFGDEQPSDLIEMQKRYGAKSVLLNRLKL
jgi:HD-GYP domain-containing protein (c-di-GMP phosphodiesterase class II)